MKLPDTVGHGLHRRRDAFFEAIDEPDEPFGVLTGFKGLDRALQGIDPGFHVVVGGTGVGKSTFMVQLADQVATKNPRCVVLIYPLEQSTDALVAKSLARRARVDVRDVQRRSNVLAEHEPALEKAFKSFQKSADRTIHFEDRANLSLDAIREHVEGARDQHEAEQVIVVVDSLQALPETLQENRRTGVDVAVRELQQLALDEEVIVFAVSETARGGSGRAGLHSGKESGSIEFAAGLVFSLNSARRSSVAPEGGGDGRGHAWDRAFNESLADSKVRAEQLDLVTLRVEKNREGPAGSRIPFLFFKSIARFEALDLKRAGDLTADFLNDTYEETVG